MLVYQKKKPIKSLRFVWKMRVSSRAVDIFIKQRNVNTNLFTLMKWTVNLNTLAFRAEWRKTCRKQKFGLNVSLTARSIFLMKIPNPVGTESPNWDSFLTSQSYHTQKGCKTTTEFFILRHRMLCAPKPAPTARSGCNKATHHLIIVWIWRLICITGGTDSLRSTAPRFIQYSV